MRMRSMQRHMLRLIEMLRAPSAKKLLLFARIAVA